MFATHVDPLTGDDDMAVADMNARLSAGDFGEDGGATTIMARLAESCADVSRDPEEPSSWGKVGRNEACPCGSGKKYKHCHGVLV